MAKGHKTGGRQEGTRNKATLAAREAFQHAFDHIGGPESLATWAKENLTEFYKLYGRLIPVDIQAKGNINLTVASGVQRADD